MSRAILQHQRSALRGRLEAAIECAINALDAFDGDPDCEADTDDEASLCGIEVGRGAWDGQDPESNVVRPFQWDQRQAEGVGQ